MFRDRSLQESQEVEIKDFERELELAQSLTEELSLNYDYYRPQQESDHSLSVNFSL
jgi:hypothetical protein